MEYHDLSGMYYWHGELLELKVRQAELAAVIPGIPEEYAVRLVPVAEDQFRLAGGPADGAMAAIIRDASGQAAEIQVGTFSLHKISPDQAADLPVTVRLRAPETDWTSEKKDAFEQLLDEALTRSDGGWIEYELEHPPHEFVQFVTCQDTVIFHGSNNREIETFMPVRKSTELRDRTGRGNLQAVYGTHDGLWAMFFAVVDRERLRGSIRNGVAYFTNAGGEVLTAYNFSVNQEQLADAPWREGALYLLPRDVFRRLQLTEHAYANEWACEQEVKPLAKLRVNPQDFPFLDRVGGHDDSELILVQDTSRPIKESAVGASDHPDRFTILIPQDALAVEDLQKFIDLQRTYTPAAKYALEDSGGELTITIHTPPPAVRQMLRDNYVDFLMGEN